ncbi:hypothetical protein RFI_05991 [Reticulomyxa filosa]|uniref:Uncharacterized protein n=1 Tax=Reticulomyxa filosa TaxID=46433 RepID=X6NZ21_RETFI|nr:hypothetical protein RFI_05991 [Reticulomyxa filosa]|eukprot:ETO31133.1 hypothetical protein RFI_05991 [Reticulomyxa filosa]
MIFDIGRFKILCDNIRLRKLPSLFVKLNDGKLIFCIFFLNSCFTYIFIVFFLEFLSPLFIFIAKELVHLTNFQSPILLIFLFSLVSLDSDTASPFSFLFFCSFLLYKRLLHIIKEFFQRQVSWRDSDIIQKKSKEITIGQTNNTCINLALFGFVLACCTATTTFQCSIDMFVFFETYVASSPFSINHEHITRIWTFKFFFQIIRYVKNNQCTPLLCYYHYCRAHFSINDNINSNNLHTPICTFKDLFKDFKQHITHTHK